MPRPVDDRNERVAALAVEVPVDQLPRHDGLRVVGLPAAAGERMLGSRREDAKADGSGDPGDDDGTRMGRRPAAETSDGTECSLLGDGHTRSGRRSGWRAVRAR